MSHCEARVKRGDLEFHWSQNDECAGIILYARAMGACMTYGNANRPNWQLPPGVGKGAWDYARTPSIATEYDQFHAGHPLLDLDQKIIAKHLPEQRSFAELPLAIDLGCGTGRSLIPLANIGWRTIGIDLSVDMLEQLCVKRGEHAERVIGIQANIVQLDFLQNGIADLVLCLYSSIGMVRGGQHRLQVFKHVKRILKESGVFVVHVHNRGAWLRDPRGVRQTIRGWIASRRDPEWELGDRIYPYRGLPSMFLHIFSRRELERDLYRAGLCIEKLYKLNRQSSDLLVRPWMLPHVRAGGYIAVARIQHR